MLPFIPYTSGNDAALTVSKPAANFAAVSGLANAQNIAYGSSTYTSPSITFPAGKILLFVFTTDARIGTITSVTINGVLATNIATATGAAAGAWYANVSAGSGTVVIANSAAYGKIEICGGLVTSSQSSPSAGSYFTNAAHNTADTFTSVTVPTNGVGVAALASLSANTGTPLSWTSATRVPEMEASGAGSCGGAYTLSPGSWSPTSTSNAGAWNYTSPPSMLVAWAA